MNTLELRASPKVAGARDAMSQNMGAGGATGVAVDPFGPLPCTFPAAAGGPLRG